MGKGCHDGQSSRATGGVEKPFPGRRLPATWCADSQPG